MLRVVVMLFFLFIQTQPPCLLSKSEIKKNISPFEMVNVFVSLPSLETDQLVLRKITLDDAQALFVIQGDAEVSQYMNYDPYDSIDVMRQRIKEILDDYAHGRPAHWAITLKSTGQVIGYGGFTEISFIYGWGELAVAIAKKHWRQGYLTEVACACIAFGFEKIGLNKIKSCVRVDHEACNKFHEQLGYHCDGKLRQEIYKESTNTFYDMYEYSILRSEYFQQHEKYKSKYELIK